MSGTSRGFITMTAVGARVAGEPTYYPAHSKNGVNVDQRIQVRVIVNKPSKANQGKGEVIGMNIVAWGKLADTLARSCADGKELHLQLEPNVYKGQVFWKDPSKGKDVPAIPMTVETPAGRVKLEVEKTSYRIKQIVFGSDSNKHVKDEMDAGHRSAGWSEPGTPAAIAWSNALKIRNNEQYDAAKGKFGFARVRKIEGPNIGAYDHTKTRQQAVSTADAIKSALAAPAALPATVAPAPESTPAAPAAPPTALIAGL
jgi:hypothetical protein